MDSENVSNENQRIFSEADENLQSDLLSLASEETGMANEIYLLSEKLTAALSQMDLNKTGNKELLENLKNMNSSINKALTAAVEIETAAVAKGPAVNI